nr:hypothetical protein [Chitinophagaceae bacterium]
MKKILLSLMLVLSFAVEVLAYNATGSNCTGFACNDGKITLNASSPCGDYSFYISGPNGYVNYSTSNIPNGNYDVTGLAPGTYNVDIASSCCLQYNSSGTFCINPYSQAQSFTVNITEPACDLNINVLSVIPVTLFNCSDGQITFTPNSTSCAPIIGTLSHNGTPLSGYTMNLTSGVSHVIANLSEGNYELFLDNGYCQTSYSFTIGGPQCNIDLQVTGSSNTSGVNCTNGSINFESSSSSTCVNNGQHNVFIYKNGNTLTAYSYNFTYPQQVSNLSAGNYMIAVDNGFCYDTAYVEIE